MQTRELESKISETEKDEKIIKEHGLTLKTGYYSPIIKDLQERLDANDESVESLNIKIRELKAAIKEIQADSLKTKIKIFEFEEFEENDRINKKSKGTI